MEYKMPKKTLAKKTLPQKTLPKKSVKEQRVSKVIDALNKARSMELAAISQYMNQHYNLDNCDYGEFATNVKLIAIDEMRHAEMFAERIKELDGEPTTEIAEKVIKGQKVKIVFSYDTDLEIKTMDEYNKFLSICRENGDSVSAKLFEKILEEEQAHLNYFSNTNGHIKSLGDIYLSKIAGTASTEVPVKGFVTGE